MTEQNESVCPLCGATHAADARESAGIEFKACPLVPDGHIYVDQGYDRGPRGALLRLASDERCTCMGGTGECKPPFGTSGGCSLSDDEVASDEEDR